MQSYCLIKYGNLKHFKGSVDTQSNSLIGEYSDFVMETLMDLSTPVIEQNTKKIYTQLTRILEYMIN